ncbi:conserved hypothetical protein [delta proteobacterium NaphS2]|nr:conserved hypothetical protein [delta proteobacterium NaphS2]
MKKSLILLIALLFGFGLVFSSCVTTDTPVKPNNSNFVAPKIELAGFEVPQYDGYWYIAKTVKPTKGEAGDRGAFLPMTFTFKITNPNVYPINLEEIKYSVVFDKSFMVMTTSDQMSNWIPAGMADEVKVTTLVTVRSALACLLVPGSVEMKKRGWENWSTLEKWWKGIPEGTVPVTLAECGFTFTAGDVTMVYPYRVDVQ